MYVHLVLIKFKPGVVRDDPRVKAWQILFAALERQCDGIVRFESGWNTTDRPAAYDFGINMGFATRADLDAYGPNPAHQLVVVKLREIADWFVCDYELGG
jgi:Stress responsive A/B Barrel Domain